MQVSDNTSIGSAILIICVMVPWVVGVVVAKGFWSTVCAVIVAPWAWYLTAEFFLIG
jgi:hypothetical protein